MKHEEILLQFYTPEFDHQTESICEAMEAYADQQVEAMHTDDRHVINALNYVITTLRAEIQERDNRIKELWTDEQVYAFLIDTSNFYFKTAEGNTFFNGCDLLGEEPWTAQELLEEYKKHWK